MAFALRRESGAVHRAPAEWAGAAPEAGEPPPIAVSVRGVSKVFGTTVALDAASLDIRRGEFFSLLGPSGCGKTTLLRIIGGFETPSAGALEIAGRDALPDPPYRRRTNMIFQHLALFPHMNVAQNIAFGLEMKRVKKDEIRRRVTEALDLVQLAGYGERRVDALSGGQRQRIAMARALVNDPEVLLLDEPLGALDLQLRLQMQDELRRLHRQTGRTFIFVTHDQGEAITLSDRMAVMQGGKILQIGTPAEIYERPRHRFVAEFMGQSNFVTGRVAAIGDGGLGSVVADGLSLPCRVPPEFSVGDPVLFALRFEKVGLDPADAQSASPGELVGTVAEEIYMGATTRFVIRIASGATLTADIGNGGGSRGFRPGGSVRLSWSPDSPTLLES